MISRKDREIIAILQADGRTPVSEIARHVGLSENGVRYRLEKLEEAGYIRSYTVLLDPKRFGKNVTAIFNINASPESIKSVIGRLRDMDELRVIYQTTGVYSIMSIGLFGSIEDLNRFIERNIVESDILEYAVDVVTNKLKDTPFSL